jgi:plastocyanin
MEETRTPGRALALAAVLLFTLAFPAAAAAAKKPPVVVPGKPAGAQTLTYRFGPLAIKPGQNLNLIDVTTARPQVDGWITAFRPGLVRVRDGKSPPVDEIHLHHAVWLVNGRPTFAAGEEKTNVTLPGGFGFRYRTNQRWNLNHMIHNLTPTPERVYVEYQIDFIPDGNPGAAGIQPVDTQWVDVMGGRAYPVFDVPRGAGRGGRYLYPRDEPAAAAARRNQRVIERDGTLVFAAGHVHPGGLATDLFLTRAGRTVRIFRSRAHYYGRPGPTSWNVSMGATRQNWRVAVKAGDVISTQALYETRRSAWYESMGIVPVAMTRRPAGGVDPFANLGGVDQREVLTHGELKENRDGGGRPNPGLSDPRRLRSGPVVTQIPIKDFVYARGDLSLRGRRGLPPTIPYGSSATFVNRDPGDVVFHTITGCRAPCNRTGGISFPLADGAPFDSGQLGFGPPGFTASANRDTWSTPKNLRPGTYTYFCRVHPFMRGAFRVRKLKGARAG